VPLAAGTEAGNSMSFWPPAHLHNIEKQEERIQPGAVQLSSDTWRHLTGLKISWMRTMWLTESEGEYNGNTLFLGWRGCDVDSGARSSPLCGFAGEKKISS